MALWQIGRAVVAGKRVIAHWFWELPELPDDWRAAVPFAHEFCVNSRFVAAAVNTVAGGRPVHLVTYPMPDDAGPLQPAVHREVGERPFTVLVVFNVASNFARKNPLAAIAAFRQAFGDDKSVRLIVKFSHGDHFPEGPAQLIAATATVANIELRPDVIDAAEMEALYAEADVVLSLHRSEGLGLVLAEAMLRGLPVIATDWSGSTDFVKLECGIPIPFALVPVVDPQGHFRLSNALWAEPDVVAAAAALRRLRADPGLARCLGASAHDAARAHFAAARYVEEMKLIAQLGG